ncbi:BMP and activin membrane-bound inhibitor homolog [Ylistrum balloti]|uniref:BMP and activin membrane-bound inhibitor homolog n=1 Tax=Ylistrum balloti TaxID=509963 RepID=UPI002905E9CD|nr:BMP and activin membrane-bound inhibitor homolog [Ylistrum balloti]
MLYCTVSTFSLRMESKLGIFLLMTMVYCLAAIEGEIRCYCNEPGCISTSYMCKSALGMCYSLVSREGETKRTTQGCVDSSVHQKHNLCNGEVLEQMRGNRPSEEWPLLYCCRYDMCNYNYNDYTGNVNIVMNAAKVNNSSRHRAVDKELNMVAPPGGHVPYAIPDSDDRSGESDLWFKAAVIAVPIAGGFILILLVLLAVRMLRTDSRRHRQLIQFRRERTSLTKAQLYVTDHFSEKTEKSSSSSMFGENHNTLCKDVNVKMDKDGKVYEQVCPEQSKSKRTRPSIVIWGKPLQTDFATVV